MTERYSYIYGAARTPIGKFNGAFSAVPAPDLGAVAIREALRRSGVAAGKISHVYMGNVLSAGLGQAPARQAALKSGLSESIAATTVNKVCGSGLQAVIHADHAVRLGDGEFVVAGGMENMSMAPYLLPKYRRGHKLGHARIIDSLVHDGLWDPYEDSHMGELSERIARERLIERDAQDYYAITSYTRARNAQRTGAFDDEIVPVPLPPGGKTAVDRDEQPGSENIENFPALPPIFDKERGSITKGNSAKINDGAAALVIGGESREHSPMARILGYAVHSQDPATFALAPVGAIQKVLRRCGLDKDDIGLYEINEAFAAISLAVNDALNLNPERVNVNGGAIALGHPIGATGPRILVTLLYALRRGRLKRGVASLCIGGGEAIAIAVEMT
ncbi:MAG: thiolase family protein [Nitrospinae bacterium]|nr:thiolase family protein [Nitrospinota bacterium]